MEYKTGNGDRQWAGLLWVLALAAVTSLGLLIRILTHAELGQHKVAALSFVQEAEQTMDINAKPETVFDVCSHFENFPHFLSNVVAVRDLGLQRSHWVIRGVEARPIEWDAVLVASERPHRQTWKFEAGAGIELHVAVQLQAIEAGTRVTVSMSWPSASGADDLLAGTGLDQVLAADLQRLKQFIERGLSVPDNTAADKESGPIFH